MCAHGNKVILITGAAGFLGSAATVKFARHHHVVALDKRQPSAALRGAAESVVWHQVDITDPRSLATVFAQTRRHFGRVDHVLHFAAYYHFGTDQRPEYELVNVQGTENVLRCAMQNHAGRFVFASSIAALLPPPHGGMLDERSPTSDYIPYGKSKGIGERLVRDASPQLPGLVLRIAGVFSSWCELPPLASVIQLWCSRYPMNRIIVGQGNTAIPYIHQDDFVRLLSACIDRDKHLSRYEVLLASQHGSVAHSTLFRHIWDVLAENDHVQPIHLNPRFAKVGLHCKRVLSHFTRTPTYEQPWMLQFVDRPWNVDTTHTRQTLAWDCDPRRTLCRQLPAMLRRYQQDPRQWNRRNRARTNGTYSWREPTL